MELAPIILFTYNRPHYLQETLNSLKKNVEVAKSALIIYCDGPKHDSPIDELKKIQEVRDIARSVTWSEKLEVIISGVNKGLVASIRNGVTECVNKFGRIIVLEDDLILSPYFLRYMNVALNKYVNEERVIAISGYNYPIKLHNSSQETFFLKAIGSWGWATWKRSWDLYIHDTQVLLNKLNHDKERIGFDFNGNFRFYKMLVRTDLGSVKSWAIRWYASAYINDKLSLYPTISLVRHIGNMGTNYKADNRDLIGWDIRETPITHFENKIEEDIHLRELICRHFWKYNRRRFSISSFKYAYKRIIFFNLKRLLHYFKL